MALVRGYKTNNQIQSETAQRDKCELYEKLCLRSERYADGSIEVCSRCKSNIHSGQFLRRISFKFLIGLMVSLLKPLSSTACTPCIHQSFVRCNGNTRTIPKIVDFEFKLQEDIRFCHLMIVYWMEENITTETIEFQAEELTDIFSNTTTSTGLILSLETLFNNYDIWHPIR